MTTSERIGVLPTVDASGVLVSIIVPVYFNADTLEALYERIVAAFAATLEDCQLEIVFVDDGSGDNSYAVLTSLAERDRLRVRAIRLSRNFGSHAAILAGMHACRGRYAAVIGADLQEDPVIVRDMLEQARASRVEVVLACRKRREESKAKVGFANFYYWVMRTLSDAKFPPGGFDCYLVGRTVIDALVSMNESHTSLAAQILWTGFPAAYIHYTKEERKAGQSRWTIAKKVRLFTDSLISFSRLPIKMVEFLGFTSAFIGLLYAALIIFMALFGELPPETRGWASTMVVLLVVSGIILVSIGVMGEYLWRILDTARQRPVFLVADSLNFDRNVVPARS